MRSSGCLAVDHVRLSVSDFLTYESLKRGLFELRVYALCSQINSQRSIDWKSSFQLELTNHPTLFENQDRGWERNTCGFLFFPRGDETHAQNYSQNHFFFPPLWFHGLYLSRRLEKNISSKAATSSDCDLCAEIMNTVTGTLLPSSDPCATNSSQYPVGAAARSVVIWPVMKKRLILCFYSQNLTTMMKKARKLGLLRGFLRDRQDARKGVVFLSRCLLKRHSFWVPHAVFLLGVGTWSSLILVFTFEVLRVARKPNLF